MKSLLRLFRCLAGMAVSLGLPALAGAAERALPPGVVQTRRDARIAHYEFPSAALHKQMAFTVVFPENYSPDGAPWPVLFFLHGLGRHENTLVEDAASRQQLLAQPYVIVLPKSENGWYFDSPFDPSRQYASDLNEVFDLAGRTLNISTERSQRAIGGWSAGGFGSVWACLHYPESFSTLATIIAVVDFPAPDVRFPIDAKTFGTDPARWSEFDPLQRAAELKNIHILLVIGEKASDAAMNERFSEALTSAGIPHETVNLPGGHTFPTVQGGLGPVLGFVRKHLSPQTAGTH